MFSGHPGAFSMLMALLITGTCLTFVVLCAYAYTSWNPVSRPCMNRVSLRLLALALIFNLGFWCLLLIWNLIFQANDALRIYYIFSRTSPRCSPQACSFALALNLHLILVPQSQRAKDEKFYYLGTVIFAAACSVTPLAQASMDGVRMLNVLVQYSHRGGSVSMAIGTESFWLPFMATGEAFMGLSIIAFFISHEMATRRRRHFDSNTSNLEDRYLPESPFVKYRYTIIRIGLYPLVSCLINFGTAILDIYQLNTFLLTGGEQLRLSQSIVPARNYSLLAFTGPFIHPRSQENMAAHEAIPPFFPLHEPGVPTLTQISGEFTQCNLVRSANTDSSRSGAREPRKSTRSLE
ncbi:hypothetical protein C8F04DRAFT_127715 [Mycena alexandri]|uniref:Uncharacterized protein n=1 Tax=Mycena alexandri TaxID=1745969 RepID=A0AAD6SGL5_9AGAR|nr:hypothetical protein C8F04DRAFT_127715 [Mycena alexandri]